MRAGSLPLEHRTTRTPLSTGWLTAIGLVVALGFCAICAKVLWDVRRAASAQASQAMANLVAAIEADIARNIELFDLSLQGVIDGLKLSEIKSVTPDIRQRVLFGRAAAAKYMESILVIDHGGNLVFDSRSLHPAAENFADRDYFLAHLRNADLGLYVSRLQVNRSFEYVIGISRRLSKPDGSFAGVVVGTLRLAYFRELFERLTLGTAGTLTLLRTDGTVLMRFPFHADDVGRDLSQSELFRQFARAPSGSFHTVAVIDHVSRLFTYSQIGNHPLIVSVGLSTKEIYAAWREEALVIALMMLGLCGVAFALAMSLRREFQRRLGAERELAIMARTDSLTGLPNRRYFDEVIDREWRRAARHERPIALLMIDADWFKVYNDTYGHQAGDKLLTMIAACVSDNARRPGDLSVRYGGEEFAALLPGTDLAGATEVANCIRASVADLNITHPTNANGVQTVSVGVASLVPAVGDHHRILVSLADMALYQAKNSGRNRTVCAENSATGLPAGPERTDRHKCVA